MPINDEINVSRKIKNIFFFSKRRPETTGPRKTIQSSEQNKINIKSAIKLVFLIQHAGVCGHNPIRLSVNYVRMHFVFIFIQFFFSECRSSNTCADVQQLWCDYQQLHNFTISKWATSERWSRKAGNNKQQCKIININFERGRERERERERENDDEKINTSLVHRGTSRVLCVATVENRFFFFFK